MSTILQSSSIWNKLERWKHSVSGCLMSWPQIKKIIILKCLLLFYTTTSHFSIGLWCVMKSGFYMTMGEDQLSGWTEKKLQSTSQSQTSPKKRSSSLLGGLLPVWSTTAFWIQVKPLYLISMFSKSMRCTENCNACSQQVNTKDLILPHDNAWLHVAQPMLQKLNELGYSKFCLSCHIHLNFCQLTTTSSRISITFCRDKASTMSRRPKMFSNSLSGPEARIFILQK